MCLVLRHLLSDVFPFSFNKQLSQLDCKTLFNILTYKHTHKITIIPLCQKYEAKREKEAKEQSYTLQLCT